MKHNIHKFMMQNIRAIGHFENMKNGFSQFATLKKKRHRFNFSVVGSCVKFCQVVWFSSVIMCRQEKHCFPWNLCPTNEKSKWL